MNINSIGSSTDNPDEPSDPLSVLIGKYGFMETLLLISELALLATENAADYGIRRLTVRLYVELEQLLERMETFQKGHEVPGFKL